MPPKSFVTPETETSGEVVVPVMVGSVRPGHFAHLAAAMESQRSAIPL